MREGFELFGQWLGLLDPTQGDGELDDVPVDRLGLAGEGVEAGMVEIGGGEGAVPGRREAPGAVIEALRGDCDIVAVEHAMDEAGGDIGGSEARGLGGHAAEEG